MKFIFLHNNQLQILNPHYFEKKPVGAKPILTAREVDFKNLNLMVITLKRKWMLNILFMGHCVLLFLAIVC